jgi:hypothetical protein
MVAHFADADTKAMSLKREPGAIALGVALAVIGANFSVQAFNHGGFSLWWLCLTLPTFMIGMYGATYEASGGKSRTSPAK